MSTATATRIKPKKQITELQRRRRAGLCFTAPFIIGFMCFYLQPLALSLYYTFLNVQPAKGGGVSMDWHGLGNYQYLFNKETDYWQALVSTLGEMAKNTPVILVFSLFISVILNQKFTGRMFARAVFFMPVVVTSGIVIKFVQGDTFIDSVETDASTTIFNAAGMTEILKGMNLPEEIVKWFTEIVNQTFDTLWKCGVQILLFLAALQGVSPQLYEAAKIEGATGWEIFWKVTFPNVAPIVLVNLIYTIIDSITDVNNKLMTSVNTTAYKKLMYSVACLESWIFFLILLAIIGIVFGVASLITKSQSSPANK